MKKSISILVLTMLLTVFIIPATAGSNIYEQYDTGTTYVDSGTVAIRACYMTNSYATLDGYVYCNKNGNTRNMGAHTFSLVGNREYSLFKSLSDFWKMEENMPSESKSKNCASMSSAVQALRYTDGATLSSTYTDSDTNTWVLFNNPNWYHTGSYKLSIFSTLHNCYSSSNDFYMYPVVVGY